MPPHNTNNNKCEQVDEQKKQEQLKILLAQIERLTTQLTNEPFKQLYNIIYRSPSEKLKNFLEFLAEWENNSSIQNKWPGLSMSHFQFLSRSAFPQRNPLDTNILSHEFFHRYLLLKQPLIIDQYQKLVNAVFIQALYSENTEPLKQLLLSNSKLFTIYKKYTPYFIAMISDYENTDDQPTPPVSPDSDTSDSFDSGSFKSLLSQDNCIEPDEADLNNKKRSRDEGDNTQDQPHPIRRCYAEIFYPQQQLSENTSTDNNFKPQIFN